MARPLALSLATLAGTPDDAPSVGTLLDTIAQLVADRVAAVSYASVTAMADAGYTTVAASSDVARAVDEVQCEAQDGPCIQAIERQDPIAVLNTATTMRWPGFARIARRYGLSATMSAPLYVGSGACIAVLNMHGRDLAAMVPLIYGVWSVYRPDRTPELALHRPGPLDPGRRELVAGLSQALAVRNVIQAAIQVVRDRQDCTAHDAYLYLVQRTAATGMDLPRIAARQLTGDR